MSELVRQGGRVVKAVLQHGRDQDVGAKAKLPAPYDGIIVVIHVVNFGQLSALDLRRPASEQIRAHVHGKVERVAVDSILTVDDEINRLGVLAHHLR